MNATQFNEQQYNNAYDESMKFHYWNLYRNNFILKFIKQYQLNKILDVGGGRGLVTDFLFKNKIIIQGVELGNSSLLSGSEVRMQYNTDALNLDPNLDIETITLFDVIEHIEKPIEFLNNLISHFKNVKNILITVPARQELWSNFDDFNGHFKRYHLEDSDKDFKECKADIIHKQYFFHFLYFLIWINNKLFNKDRVIDYSRAKPMSSIEKFVQQLIANFFSMERLIFPEKSKGSSIILLLKVK